MFQNLLIFDRISSNSFDQSMCRDKNICFSCKVMKMSTLVVMYPMAMSRN